MGGGGFGGGCRFIWENSPQLQSVWVGWGIYGKLRPTERRRLKKWQRRRIFQTISWVIFSAVNLQCVVLIIYLMEVLFLFPHLNASRKRKKGTERILFITRIGGDHQGQKWVALLYIFRAEEQQEYRKGDTWLNGFYSKERTCYGGKNKKVLFPPDESVRIKWGMG